MKNKEKMFETLFAMQGNVPVTEKMELTRKKVQRMIEHAIDESEGKILDAKEEEKKLMLSLVQGNGVLSRILECRLTIKGSEKIIAELESIKKELFG